MDDLTAERYDPRRRRKPRPADGPGSSPPNDFDVIEMRRRILLGQESPGDRIWQESVTPQRK